MFLDISKPVNILGGDRYFVDTNVWYWMTYVSSKEFIAVPPKNYQVEIYPAFVERILSNNAQLFYSPLVLVELAGLIERSEHAIHNKYHGELTLKQFRKKVAERRGVIEEVRGAWDTIKSMASPLSINIDLDFSESLLNVMESCCLDGYDFVYCSVMRESGISNIITDDKDFRSVGDVNLYGCYSS